jgi:hypothetical protein
MRASPQSVVKKGRAVDQQARDRMLVLSQMFNVLGTAGREISAALQCTDAVLAIESWQEVKHNFELGMDLISELSVSAETQHPHLADYDKTDGPFIASLFAMLGHMGDAITTLGRLSLLVGSCREEMLVWATAGLHLRQAIMHAGMLAKEVIDSNTVLGDETPLT